MDLRSCQLFLELADTRHFGRAAARCNLSPSAVSRKLQRLEEEVGQKLIDRDSRQVTLTPAGRHFLDYARKTTGDWQQLRSDLNAGTDALNGEVSLFGSVTASYSLMSQILPQVRVSYPGLEIKLRTGDQADGVRRVLAGEEDCAIIARPDALSARLSFLRLNETPLRLIGPRTPSALTRELQRHLDEGSQPDWSATPFVLAEHGLARERLLARLGNSGAGPLIYAQVAGHEAVVAMVSLGFGVALVPQLVVDHSPKRETVRTLPWLDDLPPFELGLCALAERTRDPLLAAFRECAERIAD